MFIAGIQLKFMIDKTDTDSLKNISDLSKSVLRTLLYYDIFSYPLNPEEIYTNLNTNHVTTDNVRTELEKLETVGLVYSIKNFYMLKNNEYLIDKRRQGNELAEKKIHTAVRMSNIISKFPFVRCILLSGSISKGYMESDSDIDFFIITHPDRVWFSKLLLMLFKKIFLLNSKKNFCINYFIDEEKLDIDEKNIFTATELITLIPTFGSNVYDTFYENNIWIKNYYPNFPKRVFNGSDQKTGFVKVSIEKIFNGKAGDKLDDFSMRFFKKYITRKYSNFDPDEFKLAFKMTKKESKHHPQFFQKRVLEELNNRIKTFEEKHQITLS
jgi:hypothetical protein